MKNVLKNLMAASLATITLAGCNLGVSREDTAPEEGFYFEGFIYDGVTNERIGEYTITANQRGQTIGATVGDNGHFLLGPIQPDHDYMVTIDAEDYRDFFAVEPQRPNLPASNDNQTTQFFEAFLFPENIVSPEVTLDFFTPDGIDARPNGTLRLTPTGGSTLSAIHLDAATTLPSVGGQVWANDADRRRPTPAHGDL